VIQTRLGSFIETVANTVIGFALNFIANLVILPLFGFDIQPAAAFHMGLLFTAVSVARGYGVRRLFNATDFHGKVEAFAATVRRLSDRALRVISRR
jgi:hypothetical protein